MRGTLLTALVAVVVAVLGASITTGSAPNVDARAIVDRVDRLLRGESSEGEVTMSVVTRRWTRTLRLMVWSEGT